MRTEPIEIDGRKLTLRELSWGDVYDTRDIADHMLQIFEWSARMILGEDGKPIGIEAVRALPASEMEKVSTRIAAFMNRDHEAAAVPLERMNGATTVLPSH